jgi:phosphate uptake regulator
MLSVGIIATFERKGLGKALSDVDKRVVVERNINDARYLLQEIRSDIFRYIIQGDQKQNDSVRELDRRAIDFYEILNRLSKIGKEEESRTAVIRDNFKIFYISSKRILDEVDMPNSVINKDQMNLFLHN